VTNVAVPIDGLAASVVDVGGRSPAEIAVSIMGDLLAIRHGRPGGYSAKVVRAVQRMRESLR